jgi:hypothetical protein
MKIRFGVKVLDAESVKGKENLIFILRVSVDSIYILHIVDGKYIWISLSDNDKSVYGGETLKEAIEKGLTMSSQLYYFDGNLWHCSNDLVEMTD